MSTYFNTIIKATLMQFSKSEQSICRPSMTETSFVCRGTTIIIKINHSVYSRRGIIGFELNTNFSFHTKGLDSPHFLSFLQNTKHKTQMQFGTNKKVWAGCNSVNEIHSYHFWLFIFWRRHGDHQWGRLFILTVIQTIWTVNS